jgi:hypothetical protein
MCEPCENGDTCDRVQTPVQTPDCCRSEEPTGRGVATIPGVMFTVILQAHLNGSPSHTTRDVIDADSCEAAEAVAIAAWRDADPRFVYSPLLTTQTNG